MFNYMHNVYYVRSFDVNVLKVIVTVKWVTITLIVIVIVQLFRRLQTRKTFINTPTLGIDIFSTFLSF